MASVRLGASLRRMQVLLSAGTFSGLSDGELLDRFLERRDEIAELAFAVMVERHGPMVLGVCRRIMQDPHDAEDAFQATFLVLARKSRSVRVEGSLGRWLFGVATRVATRARCDRRRRLAHERSGLDRVEAAEQDASLADPERAEVVAVIAREIAGLPARFQAPVLLCDLEGASQEEAARRLGWPVGTVKSRLSRARARLRERLTRRGLAPADFAITTELIPASPPLGLVEATTRAALALSSGQLPTAAGVSASVAGLTQGVLWTMFVTRLKLAAAALVLLAIGSAALFSQASAQKADRAGGRPAPPAPAGASGTSNAAPKTDDQIDLEMLERAWADAIGRRDTAVVSRILADDFEGIGPTGSPWSKADYLADLAHNRLGGENRLIETKVRLFGEMGVVTCFIELKPLESSERFMKVYARRRGRWQCVALHAGGIHGVSFGENGRGHWRTAIGEWKRFDAAGTANCMSCHTANVHPEPPRAARPASEKADCIACHAAIVHRAVPSLHPREMLPAIHPDKPAIVRPPFDCRVVKIQVNVGEFVKKGTPMLELFSADLAAAKSEYGVAVSQWHRDLDVRKLREEAHKSNAIGTQALMDARNDENKSRLQLSAARQKLLLYGLGEEAIANVGKEPEAERARFTIRAPVSGTVVAVGAALGSYYDRKDVLIQVRPVSAQGDRKP
jgi:RNA polymerase sigma factor (sigma-70 family)